MGRTRRTDGVVYRRLHLALEYVLPGWTESYEKRPDVIVFSARQALVLEFKQREPPPRG